MATPFNSVPLGVSGSGAAFVLGNNNTALNLLQQGEAARRRAEQLREAARLKQLQVDAKDYLDASKFNLEGGRIFQKGLTDVVAPEAQQRVMAVYQDRTLTPMQKSMKAREIQNGYEGERQMTLQKQKYADDFLKTAIADPEINQEAIALDFAKVSRAPDGTPLRASQFDEEAVTNGILANATNYNAPVVVQNAIKGIQPAITELQTQAGRIGGVNSTKAVTARFIAIDPVTNTPLMKDGVPVINITDDSVALLKQNKRFNLLLQDRITQAKAQGVELDEKQAAADLVGPYATYKASDVTRRNAQPAQGRASGSKVNIISGVSAQQGMVAGGTSSATGGVRFGQFYSPVQGDELTFTKGTDPNPRYFTSENFTANQIAWPDRDGVLKYDGQNAIPLAVQFKRPVAALIRPSDGRPLLPPPNVQTEQQWLEWARKTQQDPRYAKYTGVGTMIEVAAKKGQNNYSGNRDEVFAQLKGEEAAKAATNRKYVPKSDEKLREAADRLTVNDAQVGYLNYFGTQAANIDRQTQGGFRNNKAYFDKVQRLRGQLKASPAPAKSKADPLGFTPKPAAKPKLVGKNNALGF